MGEEGRSEAWNDVEMTGWVGEGGERGSNRWVENGQQGDSGCRGEVTQETSSQELMVIVGRSPVDSASAQGPLLLARAP